MLPWMSILEVDSLDFDYHLACVAIFLPFHFKSVWDEGVTCAVK